MFAFALLALQTRGGFRQFEAVVICLVGVIVAGFAFQMLHASPNAGGVAHGLFVPGFSGTESVVLAAGILGATVMPHVIYLHSALTQSRVVGRSDAERKKIFHFERVDVIIAMAIAGVVNMAMLIAAAGIFHATGLTEVSTIEGAYKQFGAVVGDHADTMFGIALLASGLSSSSVGTLAGQVVMQGFVERSIPLMARRLMTMVPALVVLAIGVSPTRALVLSQVALSFGIPFALIPLVWFCRNRRLMGALTNHRLTTVAGVIVAAVIVALNIFLLAQIAIG